jgi:hypothetical protein
MSLQLNPMGISGPNSSGNYVQQNTGAPTVNANVASYPVGANSDGITWPIPAYTQNLGSAPPAVPTVFYPTNLDFMRV